MVTVMIILIGGEKGGTGKTTIAINLAVARTKETGNLLLIDTDRQPSASFWCSIREDNNIKPRIASVQKFDKGVRTEVLFLKEKYQDIIIDAGGRDSLELRGALLVADKVVFPLRPSQFDLWTLGRLNTLIEVAGEVNSNLKVFLLINQVHTNPIVKEVEEAKMLIAEFPKFNLLKTLICERISFRRATIRGMSVIEYLPEDYKATEEIKKLYEEIFCE